jgi:hypothetical protein
MISVAANAVLRSSSARCTKVACAPGANVVLCRRAGTQTRSVSAVHARDGIEQSVTDAG